jgi:hypothetical protein
MNTQPTRQEQHAFELISSSGYTIGKEYYGSSKPAPILRLKQRWISRHETSRDALKAGLNHRVAVMQRTGWTPEETQPLRDALDKLETEDHQAAASEDLNEMLTPEEVQEPDTAPDLLSALELTLRHYLSMFVFSPFDPEKEEHVIAARAAIKQATSNA